MVLIRKQKINLSSFFVILLKCLFVNHESILNHVRDVVAFNAVLRNRIES